MIQQALEQGINFFDTANAYSDGTSEEIVGRALKDFARRDEVVLATKVYMPLRNKPNVGGLSRKAIFNAIDEAYSAWAPTTSTCTRPIAGTMPRQSKNARGAALHDVVKAGKARYIGASSMYAWPFAKALYTAERHGWTRFDCSLKAVLPGLPVSTRFRTRLHSGVNHRDYHSFKAMTYSRWDIFYRQNRESDV